MSSSLKVKLSARKDKAGVEFWEGTVTYPGLRGKLTRRSDDSTQFSTRAAAMQAARNLGKALNTEATLDEPVAKQAAKKSATKSNSTKPKATGSKSKAKKVADTPKCDGSTGTCSPPWLA